MSREKATPTRCAPMLLISSGCFLCLFLMAYLSYSGNLDSTWEVEGDSYSHFSLPFVVWQVVPTSFKPNDFWFRVTRLKSAVPPGGRCGGKSNSNHPWKAAGWHRSQGLPNGTRSLHIPLKPYSPGSNPTRLQSQRFRDHSSGTRHKLGTFSIHCIGGIRLDT